MPILVVKAIHSFSSEDPLYPASNLLLSSIEKKWKCQSPGGPSAQVVLQLEKPSTITAIDIGNEHSAFIEVFVSKSGSSEFKQILLMSSFMTPIESRNSDPVNRVRCFGKLALVETLTDTKLKWDLVKVICTQPFNKHVQYGLSFIKLHSPVESNEPSNTASSLSIQPKLFGSFKIREDSPDSESESSQSLFARWKNSRTNGHPGRSPSTSATPLSAAAAIRNASASTSIKNHSPQINRTKITPKRSRSHQSDDDDAINNKSRNRSELMYEDEDDEPNEKLDKIINKEKERLQREKTEKKNSEKDRKRDKNRSQAVEEVKTNKFKDFIDDSVASSSGAMSKISKKETSKSADDEEKKLLKKTDATMPSSSSSSSSSRNKRHSSPIHNPPNKKMKETKERAYKPFNKLLEGVVLVISGIQNPIRATVRQHALNMGAKYKPDWDSQCTHLICAFKNTPKYNQVHGHGKIIQKEWITECHSNKMRIPWRRFAVDSDDAAGSESEDEIYDRSLEPTQSTSKRPSDNNDRSSESPKKQSQDRLKAHSESPSKGMKSSIVVSSDDEEASLDRYNLNSSQIERNEFVSSGSDTEDEIRRVLQTNSTSKCSNKPIEKISSTDDVYNVSTEEENENKKNNRNSETLTPLPEFFKGKRFYLSKNISSTDELKLKRFITIYGGDLTHSSPESDFIISNSPKSVPSEYKGEVVKPLWIIECNDLEMLLPTKRYNFSNW